MYIFSSVIYIIQYKCELKLYYITIYQLLMFKICYNNIQYNIFIMQILKLLYTYNIFNILYNFFEFLGLNSFESQIGIFDF